MPQSNAPELKLTNAPLHSSSFRSSIPDGAVMDPSKAGAIVAIDAPELLAEVTTALEGLGLIVAGCSSKEELAVFMVASIERPEVQVPEVVVLDACLLCDAGELVELFRRAGCLDDIIVILPESWPRGVTPAQLEDTEVLQAPFPMSVLVEEVARRMTPASVRHF
ncbi:MAG: hypothetical protein HOW73_08660 [Polyangiaceae bacterium]|nr:hypothetical protein [Polyangiaceae bacterium]